jgi:DNA-binding NarL/FixJ family response regulator
LRRFPDAVNLKLGISATSRRCPLAYYSSVASTVKQASEDLRNQNRSGRARVFIVEDHPVFRQGLAQMINHEKDLTVCGEANDSETARKRIPRATPNIVLVDISLPGKSGLDLIKGLRTTHPEMKLLVVSMHDEAVYANRVLRAGGDGYIMKQEDPDEILQAIRDVLRGHTYVSETILAGGKKGAVPKTARNHALDLLSDSELEILELLGWGKSNEEIGRQLRLKPRVVGNQVKAIGRKLGMGTTHALIRFAVCWVEGGADYR